jgi:hypothetical protein
MRSVINRVTVESICFQNSEVHRDVPINLLSALFQKMAASNREWIHAISAFGNGIVEIRMIDLDTGSATGISGEMVTPRSLACQVKNAKVCYV